jgi:peptide/nickel transport system permease protein
MLLGITLLSFGVMQLAPGKPGDAALDLNVKAAPDARARFEKIRGLDKPWWTRYGLWLKDVARGDLGVSFKDDRPVWDKIRERLPNTLLLNVASLGLVFFLALPLGVYSALRPGSWGDRVLTLFTFVGFSAPTFWLALLGMILFGLKLGWLPLSGLHSLGNEEWGPFARALDTVRHLILPAALSALTGLAGLSRYMRNGLLEVIHQDYIRTARAKGLSESRILVRHALRNALIPVATILGLSLPDLIGGGFIFETIFAYPGMGRLGFEAVMARDYPVIMGVGLLTALLTLLGNALADAAYAILDPRVRYAPH